MTLSEMMSSPRGIVAVNSYAETTGWINGIEREEKWMIFLWNTELKDKKE